MAPARVAERNYKIIIRCLWELGRADLLMWPGDTRAPRHSVEVDTVKDLGGLSRETYQSPDLSSH